MKKLILFILTFILYNQNTEAQNQKISDSLKSSYNFQTNIEQKVETAQLLFQHYKHLNPKTAFKYANDVLNMSVKNDYNKGIGLAYHNLAYYYRFLPNIDSSRFYFKKSLNILKQLKSVNKLCELTEDYATFECVQGNYDKAIEISEIGYTNALNARNNKYMLQSLNRKTTINMDKGDFETATKENILALKILDTLTSENKLIKAVTLGQSARIEMLRGNYQLTLKPLKESLNLLISLKNKNWTAVTYIEIGNAYWYLEDYNNAIKNYNKSLVISKEIKREDFISINLSNIASIYSETGNHAEAIKILKESLEIEKQIGSLINLSIGYNALGSAYYNTKQYKLAVKNHTLSIHLSDSIKAMDVKRDGLYNRSIAYDKLGQHKTALLDIKNFINLKDSIFNLENAKQVDELKTKYETEKKEAEIALQEEEIKTLNAQAKNDKLTKTIYGIGIISLLAIAGLLYFGFKQRLKKNKIERDKQEAIYKQEIAFKKKELASQTLHLVQKNTFIQELKENLEKIKKSPELFKVEFRRLVMLLKKESAEDKDWEIFKSYFSEVHNNFDNKIKAIAVDISEKEIRLASFLRMNLSTKEIASMLNVLPDSVLKSKYRLKKKLKLDKEIDLNEFLNTL